jgi:hypothetical protein
VGGERYIDGMAIWRFIATLILALLLLAAAA